MNKTKKILITIMSVALIATVMIGGTWAYFTDAKEQENIVTLGHVQIRLDEPEFEKKTTENDVVTYRMDDVLPTQTIIKDPTITVDEGSENCYLRVKIEVTGFENLPAGSTKTADEYIAELEDALQVVKAGEDIETGNSVSLNAIASDGRTASGWFKSGEYYYYCGDVNSTDEDTKKGVCKAGEVIPVFSRFTVPEKWGNEVADAEFKISIYAEAVQADYFKPKRDQGDEGNITAWTYEDGSEVIPEEYTPIP